MELFEKLNFFEPKKDALEDFSECVKDLFANLRSYAKSKYKMQFFVDRVIESGLRLKYSPIHSHEVDKVKASLLDDFDRAFIKKFGILELLDNLKDTNKEKQIDQFIKNLNKNLSDLIEAYLEKIKSDKTYDIYNMMKGDDSLLDHADFSKQVFPLKVELLKFQEWVKDTNQRVLIIFEGRDAAGKSAAIHEITENLDPKHFRIESFGIPTEEEKKNWFRRYEKVLPKPGEIVLFDRSWYNRGIIEPAMGYCTPEEYEHFMCSVCDFEEKLINNGIILYKFWLDINKNKQVTRFEMRRRDPLRYWKFSDNDEKILKKWDQLTPYIQRVMSETKDWETIPSDDKLTGIVSTMSKILSKVDYSHKKHELFSQTKSLVFLDIHGVIITDIKTNKNGDHDCTRGWDKAAIRNLNQLTDLTGAKIVIISNCKNKIRWKDLVDMLRGVGVTGDIIGKTDRLHKSLREEQIERWFKQHGKPKNWVVIDDTPYDDYAKIPEHVIRPHARIGFSTGDLTVALKKLS